MRRLYCSYRAAAVAEVLEYVPAAACATCEAHAARAGREPATHDHAVIVFVDGITDTVPVSSLDHRPEDVSPM